MGYSLGEIQQEIQFLYQHLENTNPAEFNKRIGYNGKCKVCTNPKLDEIEQLREQGKTLTEIKQILDLDLSIMSLSRHFKNHYPKNQRYKTKVKISMLEKMQEAYQQYPYLEDYFKRRDLSYMETFTNSKGFCKDTFRLCPYIQAGTVSDCSNTIRTFIKKAQDGFYKSYFGNTDAYNYLQAMENQILCIDCKEKVNEDRLDLLEQVLLYNVLNIPADNKELYFSLVYSKKDKTKFTEMLNKVQEAFNTSEMSTD